MRIIIGADIFPTETNEKEFESGDMLVLLGNELSSLLKKADYRVFNLEGPLCDCSYPIKKIGPLHRSSPKTVMGLKEIGIDLLTLANNHIMDQNEEGLKSTIETLENADIEWVGVGENSDNIKKSILIEKDEIRIGIFACAEHEFSIATKKKSGANPFDPLYSFDDVSALKESADFVAVLYHGGKEYYRYPSPRLRSICRKFIDMGADLVITQHSHCIGCSETYKSGTIVYGQGNFLFDSDDGEYGYTSLLTVVDISKNEKKIEYVPICKNKAYTRIANEQESKTILQDFYMRSTKATDEDFIETEYANLAMKKAGEYLVALSGNSLLRRVKRKIFGDSYVCGAYSERGLLRMVNFLSCESHYELLLDALKQIVHLNE